MTAKGGKMTNWRFFYHYNKPKGKITVHFRGKCYLVDDVACFVPCSSKWNKSQPKLVIQGWAEKVTLLGNNLKAIIS